ncbi:MAG: hypothetical protein Q8P15_01185 [Nanoarchaeota archaeon]|nr:hypothetical protein [Nanoarchaeota archaeon]
MNTSGKIAFFEIFILLIGIVGISWSIGSEIKVVKGEDFFVFNQFTGKVENLGSSSNPIPATAKSPFSLWGKIKDLFGFGGEETAKAVTGKMASVWKSAETIGRNAGIAYGVYYGLKLGLDAFGVGEGTAEATAIAGRNAYFIGKTTYDLLSTGTGKALLSKIGLHVSAGTVALPVSIIVFYISYKEKKTATITFECKPWQAATGGNKCEECNEQLLGCNEYQCKSLGRSCELINKGTDREMCADSNKNDVSPPVIEISEGYLLEDYEYTSPTSTGVKIEYTKSSDGCIPFFRPFSFGFTTDEPAYCKIDYQRKENFEEMGYDFGGTNNLEYNHTHTLGLPGKVSYEAENITLPDGFGNYNLYVRCQDAKPNTNSADFVFKFCIDNGPDIYKPEIKGTSIQDGMPVGFGVQKTSLNLYTNEPASCKWSTRDQAYENMEHEMECPTSISEINTQMTYTCETELVDLKDKEDSVFYFRCQDISPAKNTMEISHRLTLKGSQPLVIDSVGPEGTIKDSTEFVRVSLTAKTSAGFNEGNSKCSYSEDGEKYVEFFETGSHTHSQDLVLTKGIYKYFIQCTDLAGNSETKTIAFEVESDPYAPSIVRVYKDGSNLKLITDEEAECVYTTFGCSYSFADGTTITTSDGKNHFTSWNPKANFYIKCKDTYGNEPFPNECSITVKPLKI